MGQKVEPKGEDGDTPEGGLTTNILPQFKRQ